MDHPTKQPPVALLQSIHLEHLQASEETTGEKHRLFRKTPKNNEKKSSPAYAVFRPILIQYQKGFEDRISIKVELLVSK